MKNIDIKSLTIGVLLTSTIFMGVAAAPKDTDAQNPQKWEVQWDLIKIRDGFGTIKDGREPFAVTPAIGSEPGGFVWSRKRIK